MAELLGMLEQLDENFLHRFDRILLILQKVPRAAQHAMPMIAVSVFDVLAAKNGHSICAASFFAWSRG